MTSSNISNIGLYDDLFAYRFALMDIYTNELDIIKKLKYRLVDIGINYEEINDLLFNFYNYYNIQITYEEIQNTQIILLMFRELEEILPNSNPNLNPNLNTNLSLLTNLLNLYLSRNESENQEEEEEKQILTEEEIERLSIIRIKEEIEDDCSICFEKMEIDTEVYEITCNHKFHKNCLKPHLLNYNNRCPVCRTDIKPVN